MATVESTIVRTLKQTGHGFNSPTGSIIVHLDGNLIYTGPVPCTDVPWEADPVDAPYSDLFSWTNNIDYMGQQILTISVADCDLRLGSTLSNYSESTVTVEEFGALGFNQEVDGVVCQDPFTNITIDSISHQRGVDPRGQWWWLIQDGSVFQATINIEPGWL